MSPKIPFVLAMTIAVGGSFLGSPTSQFHSTFNSTFINESEKLFKPIIIPNVTELTGVKGKEVTSNKIYQPKETSKDRENNSDEDAKTAGDSLKFSSRYSTKPEILTENPTNPSEEEKSVEAVETTSIGVESRAFSERSDDLSNTEEELDEEEDTFRYNEPREAELSEIASTTNEPYTELQRATSFRSSQYPDDDLENYETTSTSAEDIDSNSEEKEEEEDEGKRSVKDYYNSGSKNYHLIQTPLNQVKYRGPHSFDSEEVRTRLISPIPRHHIKHNWPYSRPHIKSELEKLNEITDSDETYEKGLDEEVKAEVKSKPNHLDLELAVQQDEFKFDRNKKYNYIDERNRRKQQQKSLTAAEEEDDRRPLFHSLKQYQVEEPKYQPSTEKGDEISKFQNAWTSKPLITTPKTWYKSSTNRKQKQFTISNEPFQGHQFLGPVVFNQSLEEPKIKPLSKPTEKYFSTKKPPYWNSKGLLRNEKLDQENLANKKIQNSVFTTGSFNHLEESHEIYNAILANIQSVFGVRTQPLKGGKGSEANFDESKSLTWSTKL